MPILYQFTHRGTGSARRPAESCGRVVSALKLLRTRDVAERAGVSLVAVLKWVRQGKLRPVMPVVRGQSMLFDAREVEDFLRVRQERQASRRS